MNKNAQKNEWWHTDKSFKTYNECGTKNEKEGSPTAQKALTSTYAKGVIHCDTQE